MQNPHAMMQAEKSDHARLELAYHALNRSHGNPFVLQLTHRGFFSEVNNLFTLMLFGIALKRRMIVDQSRFNGLQWNHFYRTYLPDAEGERLQIPRTEIVEDHRASTFVAAQRWLAGLWRSGAELEIRDLGISGNVLSVTRALSAAFCVPRRGISRDAARTMAGFGLAAGKFAALHVRRGDKLVSLPGHRKPEGEATTPTAYFAALHKHAAGVRDVFVLTDDAPFLEVLRNTDRSFRLHSLCPPGEAGHVEAEFNARPTAKKQEEIDRLLVEVAIAAVSNPFIGGFKSNVARHIVSMHARPEVCHSIDAQTVWRPS